MHPAADAGNLEFFAPDYLLECLGRVIESDRASETAKQAARALAAAAEAHL